MSISNEQLISFVKKNPIGVGSGLLSLILIGTMYFRSDLLPAAQAVLDQKASEGERLAINLRYSVQLKEQLDEVMAADRAIDARLVRAAQLPTNNQYFYRLETDTGTKMTSMSQLTTTAQAARPGKTAFVPIAFNLTVQGTYVQVLDVLHRLENGAHYCRVLNASVNRVGGEGTDLLNLSLSLELLGAR